MQTHHRVAIVVLEGTLALDLAVALQAFGPRPTAFLAMRDDLDAPYDVFLTGSPGADVKTPGMRAEAIHPWSALTTADTVVIPGLDEPDRPRDPEGLAAIAEAADRGARMVGLCTGVFVLGHAGVLKGRRVTTHWALAEPFRTLFPDVELLDDELFVDDGAILSSGGMLAAADLCLHVLREDFGQAYANDVARLLVSPPFRVGGQAPYRTPRRAAAASDLAALLDWVEAHLDEPLSVPVLAAKAHMSTRTLTRRFEVETGRGALEWIAERRVARARELLEGSRSTVTEIAFASGFGSLAAFRRQFARLTGTTPTAYRGTFAAPQP